MLKAVFGLSSSLTGICKKPLAQSIVEKYFEFPNELNTSEITGMGKLSPIVTSFNLQQSTTILHFFLPDESGFFRNDEYG